MSAGDPTEFLYNLPPAVSWDFCRVMDGLSDLDWTRFASEVLHDQNAVRLAARRERRTDWVMNQWENRNGRVRELIDLLERLQLLRPRDVILTWASSLRPSPPPAPCPPPPPPPPSLSQFDPPHKQSEATPTSSTCTLTTTGGGALPRPAPPPPDLHSDFIQASQVLTVKPESSSSCGVMCWSYEEVHAGTEGFSPALQVGEGGFGVVYRATLRNTSCAVKRLKQDCLLDWTLLKESFQTEVDQLTRFRHPNIVDLLGFSEGPGTRCLIYSYMDNRSLEDQLHSQCVSLSWSQRVSIVEGAATALQFLHFPPEGNRPLIHGDVKSSNILLDRYLVAKLADFGLARFAARGSKPGRGSSERSAVRTVSVGITATVRGTLAYLPEEYVRDGELGTAVDVYSFGVVLLEVLTGRRALENRGSKGRYLKDLVREAEESPNGSSAAFWRKQLDQRLISGGAAEPAGSMEMVALACRCLDRKRKKRPAMRQVFDRLQDVRRMVGQTSSSSSSPLLRPPHLHPQPRPQSLPSPACPLDSSVGVLTQDLSRLGPLEDTYQPPQSSSSSLCSLTRPHPLLSSSSLPVSASSFAGPCETDESRGFSQYDLRSRFRSRETSCRSLSPSVDQYPSGAGPALSQFSQPSVPTEDQYIFPPQPSSTADGPGPGAEAPRGPPRAGASAESLSPVGSLHSLSPGPSVQMNSSKRRFLQKKTLYDEGRILTPELLSCDDLYGGDGGDGGGLNCRGPEESDELDYLPAEHD